MTQVSTTQRLYSLDALRGFDMFWIMGAEEIRPHACQSHRLVVYGGDSNQLTHPEWHGFHFYDLIFRCFLFCAGVATPYSVDANLRKARQGRN